MYRIQDNNSKAREAVLHVTEADHQRDFYIWQAS